MAVGSYRILHASEAAVQPVPQYLSLNYANLFKIQRVNNPFPLRPVSFSRLTSYLECPGCALEQQRRHRQREPQHFIPVHQASLFAAREPDPRLIGTLLHTVIDLLHAPDGPLDAEQQALLRTEPDVLTRFIQYDLLDALRAVGKNKLALFYDEIVAHRETLDTALLRPLISYQRELRRTGATVFANSERFQFKLLSTGETFAEHRDWGGYVGLVGEFDQIRIHNYGRLQGRPAIMEFKKGLGKKRAWDKWGQSQLAAGPEADPPFVWSGRAGRRGASLAKNAPSADDLLEPGLAHAFQLMIYWLAFQTRWDVAGRVRDSRGQIDELSMPVQQDLDLIVYNLHDSCQYRLVPTDFAAALRSVINCIFYVNWAMKSGYASQADDHDCGKTALLCAVPNPLIDVGSTSLPAARCYELAREAFQRFSQTVRWEKWSQGAKYSG